MLRSNKKTTIDRRFLLLSEIAGTLGFQRERIDAVLVFKAQDPTLPHSSH